MAKVKIVPTVGRVVLYTEGTADRFPGSHEQRAAVVADVNDDGTVNLGVFDQYGNAHARQNVILVQAGEERPDGPYCEWMEFQVGQAVKTQALQRNQDDQVASCLKRLEALEVRVGEMIPELEEVVAKLAQPPTTDEPSPGDQG